MPRHCLVVALFIAWNLSSCAATGCSEDATEPTHAVGVRPGTVAPLTPRRLRVPDTPSAEATVEARFDAGAPAPGSDIRPDRPLSVVVDAVPDIGTAPLVVSFTVLVGQDEGNLTHVWDFGDGASGAGNPIEHTYVEPGSYTARVSVRSTDGRSGQQEVGVQVDAANGEQWP
jgi:hypothetical protein